MGKNGIHAASIQGPNFSRQNSRYPLNSLHGNRLVLHETNYDCLLYIRGKILLMLVFGWLFSVLWEFVQSFLSKKWVGHKVAMLHVLYK